MPVSGSGTFIKYMTTTAESCTNVQKSYRHSPNTFQFSEYGQSLFLLPWAVSSPGLDVFAQHSVAPFKCKDRGLCRGSPQHCSHGCLCHTGCVGEIHRAQFQTSFQTEVACNAVYGLLCPLPVRND